MDRLKLREAVGELLRNALTMLPESSGRLGLLARLFEDGAELVIEVAEDGASAEQSLIDEAFDPRDAPAERPQVGLALTKAIVEQHGGSLGVESQPGGGTYAGFGCPCATELVWVRTFDPSGWNGCPGHVPGQCPDHLRDICPMERPQVVRVVCLVAEVA